MRKIGLRVEDLSVESFVPAPSLADARGTVRGRMSGDTGCVTLGLDQTCQRFASCDPHVQCEWSVVNETCPGPNLCG